MKARLIAHGTAEPCDAQPLIFKHAVLDTDTALGRCPLISGIMIPMNIENRPMRKRSQKRQIICVQVPTGEYQVNPLKLIFLKIIP